MCKTTYIALAAAACAAGILGAAPARADEAPAPVVFRFAPPIPLSYVEETVTRRATIISGEDAGSDEATIRVKFMVSKEGEGYKVRAEPQSSKVLRGGKPVNDPVLDVINSTPVTYHLDPAGKLKSIEGYAGVLEAAQKTASKNIRDSLPRMRNEKALTDKETAQWNARIGAFIGQTGARNTVWVSEGVNPLPDGSSAGFYTVTMFDRIVEQDGRKLARLRFFLTADRDSIQSRVNDMARDIVKDVPRPRPLENPAGFAISGQGERLVDPETMVVYSEKGTKEVHVNLRASDKDAAVPVLIQETRESKVLPPSSASSAPQAN